LGSEAAGAGANAYLVKPFTGEQLKPAIELALANFEKSKELEAKVQQMNEALEARKIIERAKGILMRQTGMDEEAAYLKLQKTARNENRRLVEVARAILWPSSCAATAASLRRPGSRTLLTLEGPGSAFRLDRYWQLPASLTHPTCERQGSYIWKT